MGQTGFSLHFICPPVYRESYRRPMVRRPAAARADDVATRLAMTSYGHLPHLGTLTHQTVYVRPSPDYYNLQYYLFPLGNHRFNKCFAHLYGT